MMRHVRPYQTFIEGYMPAGCPNRARQPGAWWRRRCGLGGSYGWSRRVRAWTGVQLRRPLAERRHGTVVSVGVHPHCAVRRAAVQSFAGSGRRICAPWSPTRPSGTPTQPLPSDRELLPGGAEAMTQYTEDEPAAKAQHFSRDLSELHGLISVLRSAAGKATGAVLRGN